MSLCLTKGIPLSMAEKHCSVSPFECRFVCGSGIGEETLMDGSFVGSRRFWDTPIRDINVTLILESVD
jgi:hypothetical protein